MNPNPFEVLVTYVDGQLVHVVDGSPVPEPGPWKVCENTLRLGRDARPIEPPPRRLSLHQKAVARRRKAKRGGPR